MVEHGGLLSRTRQPRSAPGRIRVRVAARLYRRGRERDGAFGWFVARDPANEERYVEAFLAESWLDYLCQLDRMMDADHAIEDNARSFHRGSTPPTVTPIIAEHPNWHLRNLLRSTT